MSTALLRLREFFDDQLLIPIGRRMVLTPLAQTLIGPSREIILRAQTLIDATPGFNPIVSDRKFVVMTSDYIASILMPSVARKLRDVAPRVQLEIVPHGADPKAVLERGEIDFLIMPEQYLSNGHPTVDLFSDHYVCISGVDNPTLKDGLTTEIYLDSGHVVPRFGVLRGMAFDEWFLGRFERSRRVEATVTSFAMLPLFVMGTDRLATVHNLFAKQYANHLAISVHTLPFEMPPIIEALQWNRFSDRHPAVMWLRDVIRAEAEKLRAPLRVSATNYETIGSEPSA